MRYTIFLPALLLLSISSAFGLSVGDPAPPLKVETMVKGEQVDLTKGVHVVEFWATWCGPCKEAIPHLTELAKTYQGRVDFTGVDVWEHSDDALDRVKKFVADMGEKMAYNVAFDGKAAVMTKTFIEAAKQPYVPVAFLVKDGVVYWVGQPGALGEAINTVLAGKVDLAAARVAFDQETARINQEAGRKDAWWALVKQMHAAREAKDYPALLVAVDKAEAAFPEIKDSLSKGDYSNRDWMLPERFHALVMTGSPEVKAVAQALLAGPRGKDARLLASCAWFIVDPKEKAPNGDYPTALLLTERAAQLSEMKSCLVLDTYALALLNTGDKAKALEMQTQAVALAKVDPEIKRIPLLLKAMEERLEEYRKANG